MRPSTANINVGGKTPIGYFEFGSQPKGWQKGLFREIKWKFPQGALSNLTQPLTQTLRTPDLLNEVEMQNQ